MANRQVVEHWVTIINEEGKGLTKWERDFMDSITERIQEGKYLSDKQIEIIERIYTEKTPT